MTTKTDHAWHSESSEDVLKALKANKDTGLSVGEHAKRLREFGPNKFEKKKRFRFLKLIWEQISSPLVFILIVAGVITYFLGEITDTIVIYIAVLINTAVGVYQEGRAGKAFERLKSSVKKYAVVMRDGTQHEVGAESLVPGDIVLLQSGDQIPADLRLFDVKGLVVNEAILTGEWMPVSKITTPIPKEKRITEQDNMAWMGTLAEDGFAKGVVVATAAHTELGRIATLLEKEEKMPTPFQIGVQKLAKIITIVIVVVIGVIFTLGILQGTPAVEMFITSVALAVAAIPEGLPIAVTVILAVGMTHTLKQGGLIKKLVKAETLGSTTVILTDKTGTLTKGEMNFAGVATMKNILSDIASSGMLKGMVKDLSIEQKFSVKTGVLTSNAFIEETRDSHDKLVAKGRPTDRALVTAGAAKGILLKEILFGEPRIDHLPFESERRFAASLNETQSGKRLYVTGALEFILPLCSSMMDSLGKVVSLNDKQPILDFYEKSTSDGMRVVATAYKDTNLNEVPREGFKEEFDGLIFTGLLGFHDPVREDVGAAIEEARLAGLRSIMVTGDHANTALAVAKEVGLLKTNKAITGEELERMSSEEVKVALKKYQVFARVLPSQKMRLVDSLSDSKEIVAMTGDGVNDAPALKKADIGIAVGSGTEVAKEAADLILLKDSFSIIISAIEGGRVVVDNLRKVVTYLLGANFSGVILISTALFLGLPLPVLTAQILWANIVEEGFMNFALAFEPKEPDVMRRTREQIEPEKIINKEMYVLIFCIGIITSIILTLLFLFLLNTNYPIEHIRTVMFAGLSVDALFFVFSLKSLRKPLWKINIFSNRYLLIAFAMSTIFLIIALVWPPLQVLLKTVTPSMKDIMLILGLGVINLFLIEVGKWYFISRKMA